MDEALARVSGSLHAFNGSFVTVREMRKRLEIDPAAAVRVADTLEERSASLINAARLLRHEAQLELDKGGTR